MRALTFAVADGAAALAMLAPLFLVGCSDAALGAYLALTAAHPFAAGFCKFALLATFGECLAQRWLTGRYVPPGFGLMPHALVWGLLGIAITLAFQIFSAGVPDVLAHGGLPWARDALAGPLGGRRLFTAFCVSLVMNTMFAPVLMVTHKVFDLHIAAWGGSLDSLRHVPAPGQLLASVDWQAMWTVVLFRSVLFFWVPAHTITFLLPAGFRVLFAAVLGAVLGLILAWAGTRARGRI